MFVKYGLPLIAIALMVYAVKNVAEAQKPMPTLPPPIQPTRNPFPNTVAGAGVVEPQTENIAMGSALPGVVVEVMVKVGQSVKKGEPLFRLDDRQLRAELAVRHAMLSDERAELDKLDAMPRPESLPPAQALMRETQADYENMKDQFGRAENLIEKGAISDEEFSDRKQRMAQALERYNKAVADYDLLRAGAWKHDKDVARSAVARVESQIKQMEIELERLTIRALVDADVLQVNVRPGEFVGAPPSAALIVLGNVKRLHVRVDIDEYDIPRLRTGAPARATLKGQNQTSFPLEFVRVEPYVIPKKSLTGDNTERVDTRVLQVIYAIDAQGQQLFVGQQLDVFVDAQGEEQLGKPQQVDEDESDIQTEEVGAAEENAPLTSPATPSNSD